MVKIKNNMPITVEPTYDLVIKFPINPTAKPIWIEYSFIISYP